MKNNIIFKIGKDYITKKGNKIAIDFVYNSIIDYYTIHQIEKSLKNFFNFFSKKISLFFLDSMNINLDVKLNNIQLARYNSYKEHFVNSRFTNSFQFISHVETGIISFSDDILLSIINILFGGSNLTKVVRSNVNTLTISETNIMKKMLDIIEKAYSFSWKNQHSINFNLSDFQLMTKSDFERTISENNVFLFSLFCMKVGNTVGSFSIGIPFSIIKMFKDKLVNRHVQSNLTIKRKIETMSWPVIYNIKIHLDIKLIGFSLFLSKILTLKIGDIVSIKAPEDVIAYSNNTPVLSGKCKMYKKKYVFFLKSF
ncbi:hypothetical protein [Buchnera aphidicola]|uniref:Flagellar motor switch protein FliM n=1 Tax=Buchnera aphidicola subsp. Melaphis rhois TaxID=118103 RepID=A0A4D6Y370_BUCMH|nr:hypothetical protein [Buchnera aphidicola]QCI23113.1 hypothetical protein D9V73_00365 [Buchnera aphidicola (Melaphis rhois)]